MGQDIETISAGICLEVTLIRKKYRVSKFQQYSGVYIALTV